MFRTIYRAARKLLIAVHYFSSKVITVIRLKGNGVQYGQNFQSFGSPVLDVWKGGKCIIGNNVSLNNGHLYNLIGRPQPCLFVVRNTAELTIGNNTGISATAIVCSLRVSIGDFVKIGGNTVIYDTDFHSLDAGQRANPATDPINTKSAAVTIGNHVFIGAHSTILKGVSIGDNSIIGSGSVVTKNIPPNEIWAGNPAKFIKAL
jgi:acetyltransferase-like isoleucine patch superfamily enzyme